MPIAPSLQTRLQSTSMSSAVKRVNQAQRRPHNAPAINAPATAGAAEAQAPSSPASEWNHVVACEARNALQVILSGGEILLDEEFGRLSAEQRMVLARMIENARHLQNLIATLRSKEEINSSDLLALIRQLRKFV